MRLDAYLAEYWPEYSRSTWQKYIKAGFVKVNGEVEKSTKHTLGEDDEVKADVPDVPSHDSRQMRPAAVFETHQYAAGQIVIAHCRPRLGKGGALIDARCAQRAFIRRQRERDAAGGASRRTDEVQPCPARGAERRIVLLNRQSARQATWRQRKPGRPYQGLDQTSDKRGLSNGHTGVIAET